MQNRPLVIGAIVVASVVGFIAWNLVFAPSVPEQSELVQTLEEAPPPSQAEDTSTAATADETIEGPAEGAPDDFPAIVDNALRNVDEREIPIDVGFEILETLEHDTAAFTQGFEISNGRLFESTGLVGQSTIRELEPDTGAVIRSTDVPDVFAEGITVVEDPAGDTAIQLTWQDEIAFRYDLETFDVIGSYEYEGQGWGICHDGDRLVMSNGSDRLQFRDADTFELVSEVEVTLSGAPVQLINELECVDEAVWANIWQSSLIIQIDPSDGVVTRVLNARALTPAVAEGSNSNVLNGIAFDPADGTYLLTGKRWPVTYRVQLFDGSGAG